MSFFLPDTSVPIAILFKEDMEDVGTSLARSVSLTPRQSSFCRTMAAQSAVSNVVHRASYLSNIPTEGSRSQLNTESYLPPSCFQVTFHGRLQRCHKR